MKRWARALVIVIASGLSLGLAGCSNPNNVEYRVLDRFRIADYGEMPESKQPPEPQFLWVKAWGTENQDTPKAKDVYIEKELWDTCWLGDKYTVRYIGKDTCERTPESEMPTELEPGYAEKKAKWDEQERQFKEKLKDPEFRKKLEEKYGKQ